MIATKLLRLRLTKKANFTFDGVPPGYWYVVVTGRFGMNNAIWDETAQRWKPANRFLSN